MQPKTAQAEKPTSGSRKSPCRLTTGVAGHAESVLSHGIEVEFSGFMTQRHTSQTRCPACKAADVRAFWLVRRVVGLQCGICGTAWDISDRRSAFRLDDALIRFLPENHAE